MYLDANAVSALIYRREARVGTDTNAYITKQTIREELGTVNLNAKVKEYRLKLLFY